MPMRRYRTWSFRFIGLGGINDDELRGDDKHRLWVRLGRRAAGARKPRRPKQQL